MLQTIAAAVCLSAAFAGQAPADAAGPVEFRLESAAMRGTGVIVRYTTSCGAGLFGSYGLAVTLAQRTGAHVAVAGATIREQCARRPRTLLLRAEEGVAFRPGRAYARVWGCAGAGCFEVDPAVLVPVRLA